MVLVLTGAPPAVGISVAVMVASASSTSVRLGLTMAKPISTLVSLVISSTGDTLAAKANWVATGDGSTPADQMTSAGSGPKS